MLRKCFGLKSARLGLLLGAKKSFLKILNIVKFVKFQFLPLVVIYNIFTYENKI